MPEIKLTPTTAFEAFGRVLTMAEVKEAVPLLVMLDGFKKGWVYDARHSFIRDGDDPLAIGPYTEARYEYRGDLFRDDEGRLLRGMWLIREVPDA